MCYVWLVGHDPRNREFLRGQLEDAQLEVAEISSLMDAFALVAAQGDPRVIVVDLAMPFVLRQAIMESLLVRERLREIPRFCISNLDPEVAAEATRVGAGSGELAALALRFCAPACYCHELVSMSSAASHPHMTN
jgi:CheY-like chemotaxis protein